jgi:tetratricopeptide (TPR) repeat protein
MTGLRSDSLPQWKVTPCRMMSLTRLRYNIVQLLAQTGEFERAATYLERWLANETTPSVEAHKLAAGVYHQLNNNAKVIEHARAAIARSDRPDESVYQLLLASYFEIKQYQEAASLLQRMLVLFPDNNEYWRHSPAPIN